MELCMFRRGFLSIIRSLVLYWICVQPYYNIMYGGKQRERNASKEISRKKSKYACLTTRTYVVTLYTSKFQPDTKRFLIDFLCRVTPLPADTANSRSNDWKHSCMSKSNLFLSPSSIVMLFTDPDQVWNKYICKPVARRISEVSV
jgi:hypothetical protein